MLKPKKGDLEVKCFNFLLEVKCFNFLLEVKYFNFLKRKENRYCPVEETLFRKAADSIS